MTHGILRLKGVSKTFTVDGRKVEALSGIDLALRPGQFTALVGASGCGKSTLLRLIAGLDVPDAGQILLDGTPINGPSRQCGLIFQDHRLLPWLSVAQNIELALAGSRHSAEERRALALASLELVGLKNYAGAFPRQLSGGMAQRVALARGFVNRPRLLLLDEPFSALDSLTRARLQTELLQIWAQENVSMLLVTHDVEEAVLLADRVIVLAANPGRINAVLDIELPRPRLRGSAELAALKTEILRWLDDYAVAA
jgi:ABC-type nitrate/sulfonate/bicarbonate transport system ATPase subunit